MNSLRQCVHGRRQEYCTDGEANAGDAEVVIEALDELLYETEGVRHLHFGLRDKVISRSFSFVEQLFADGPAVEHEILIQHDTTKRPIRESYNVQYEWRPLGSSDGNDEYSATYAIGKYHGSVQACMVQPSLVVIGGLCAEMKHQSDMTPYDYVKLYETLGNFSERHHHERAITQVRLAKLAKEEME